MKEEGKKKKDELKTEQWKKERERWRTEDWISEEKKKNRRPNQWKKKRPNPGEEMKKKKKSQRSKVAAMGYGITKMPLSYELWKLKTAKMCFQFP